MVEIDSILKKEVDDQKTPSVQYVIFKSDTIIHQYQNGYAHVKNRQKVDDKTTYKAFSVTKTFTALAIMQLVEENKVCIEDPVIKYLPEFPYPEQITVKQLLSHSSGIPNPIPLNWIHLAHENQAFDRNKFFSQIFQKNNKLKFKPGEKFSYSNLGYVILGQLIEKVSGLQYETYVRDHIFKPLNLQPDDMSFTVVEYENHAKGYVKRLSVANMLLGFFLEKKKYIDPTEGSWIAFKNSYVNGASYGGLIGTPMAFVKYLQELLKNNCLLLSEFYKRMLFTENYTGDKASGMGLSWFSGQLNGNQYFAHAGGGGGYYSEIRIYPDSGIGSVIMFNRTGMTDERFLNRVDSYFIK